LSLANLYIPQLPSTLGDKVNHLIAYGVLMGWCGQLYTQVKERFLIAIALIGLGVAMELAQGLTFHRHFDLLDAVANGLGVFFGWLALALGADKILLWFERYVLCVK